MAKGIDKKGHSGSQNEEENKVTCFVSYSINNYQPVVSTYIGDQPFFYYTNEEEDYTQEDFFYGEDLDYLENEILDLKKKIEAYDNMSSSFELPFENTVNKFSEDLDYLTEKHIKKENEEEILADIVKTISKSRMAKTLMDIAKEIGIEITPAKHVETAKYDRSEKKIFVNTNIEKTNAILFVARELQHCWQDKKSVLVDPLAYDPDSAVLINRILNADTQVAIIRIAWELQIAGYKKAWERVENSSLSDLGRSLAREAFMDFRTLNNGNAAASVFETWFLSQRSHNCDRDLIQLMLSDYQGYMSGNGKESTNSIRKFINLVGEMPYGKNYLLAYTEMIMEDPLFTDVRDRSNSNFLWFIKFERSFKEAEREMEQELQSDEVIHNRKALCDSSDNNERDCSNECESSIQMPKSNVIHVQFGRNAR